MLSTTIQEALNIQLGSELASSYLYLSMAAYFETRNLRGFAHWMRLQHQEETTHALKFFDMLNDRGGQVHLPALPAPASAFESPLDVMQQALEHEQQVTASINHIYALAMAEQDYTTQAQLQWFITEQVEEEVTLTQIVEQLKLTGSQGPGLFLLDRELGARTAGPRP